MIKCKRCHERYEGDVCPLCGLIPGKKRRLKAVPNTFIENNGTVVSAADYDADAGIKSSGKETMVCDYKSALICPVCSRLFFAEPQQRKKYKQAKRRLNIGIILSVIMFLGLSVDITLKFLIHASDNVGIIENLITIIFYKSGNYGSSYCKGRLIAFIICIGILFIAGAFLLLSLRFTSKTPDLKVRAVTKFFLGAVILLTLHCMILGNYYAERYSDLRKRKNRYSVLNTEEAVFENVSEIYYIDAE